ncbi:dehydrogenase [Saccharothrix sp. ALI-22-I]|uniref:isocitrate/isopropylmalate dehydrogenase family protein n=1 Tax=Saccharothrix sp. ALI-22-I TaxID=1933778 RepID=UPI00097C1FFD|nr:isocitrate/isopropylmalate family dehydrogenase [Saccharothrix sp. ALI-22-I]ONI88796.1 dehydrogenase [Saccharothrix sp. ALI-22-I]
MTEPDTAKPVVVIPGDGIGPQVIEQALAVLDDLDLGLKFDVFDHVHASTYLAEGHPLSDADLRTIRESAGVLLGAIGDPRVRTPDYARGVLLRLRFELDLYVNYRPVRLLQDRLSPVRDAGRRLIDCAVVRENTEGLYVGVGGVMHQHTEHETAVDVELSSYRGVTRVIDFALKTARRGVCMVDKSNAVPNGGGLWQRCWAAARQRPEIDRSHLYVDAATARLVQDPTAFDVIVTTNSYGDILSDLTAQLAGGLGLAPSANLNPDTGLGLYEPVHGSAPDIAGTGSANPIGAILSAALMLERTGYATAAAAVRAAVSHSVAAWRCTPDIGGDLSTQQAGEAIRAALH